MRTLALIASLAAAADPAKSVLLVTWDTTRADHVGCYGAKQARTPGFDALASNGVLYERAWAAAPITLPSHATILTGVYPCAHGARDNALFVVGTQARLLSEALREAGFRTGAFVGSFILDRKFGLDQGFEVYDCPDPAALGTLWNVIDRPAPAVAEPALRFVDSLEPGERFFLWVHFYDPHVPHEVEPGGQQPGEAAYDAEIARCDRELRRILERLRARGLDDGLVTVVTADHGESNGEHREETHGSFVYDATMRVPLVVAPPPPGVAPGTRVRVPVSTADVAATLLERLGLGRDLLPHARTPTLPTIDTIPGGDDERALYLENFMPYYSHRWHPLRAVVWKGLKYVEAPRPELYDLAADPGELHDVAAERAELCTRLQRRLAALAEEHAPLHWEEIGRLSFDDQGKLEQLGYGSAAIGGDPFDPTLPDPKDRIGDAATLDEIEQLMAEAHIVLGLDAALRTGRLPELPPEQKERGEALLAKARARVDALRAANPRDPTIDHLVAAIAIDLRDYAAAIAPLERAAALAPRNMQLRYNLAVAYAKTGRPEWAQREMEKAIWLEPRSLAAHRWLLQFTVSRRDWPAAAWWEAELRKCPGQSEADLENLARARERIERELAAIGAAPRAPAPFTEAELLPEGARK